MSSAQKPVPTPSQAEELLCALEGVVSAHVVTEPTGKIVEIHVLAAPDLHPKQVVRNVESALSAGLGIGIDRRVVSVAQIRTVERGDRDDDRDEGPAAPAAPAGDSAPATKGQVVAFAPTGSAPDEARGPRLAGADERTEAGVNPATARGRLEYVRYEARRDAGSCTVEVVLREGALELTGRGVAPDTEVGRAEAAARAVMEAVAGARPALRLALEGAVLTRSRGRTFVLVSAHVVQDRATVSLAGAAPVARSPEEAAILASLQATNRWSG